MKKYMILLAALLAAACAKTNDVVPRADKLALTFSADAAVTKTSLGADWSVSWVEDDAVSILWKGGKSDSRARLKDRKAFFSAVVDETDTYYAVYPASIPASVGADGQLSFSIPSVQSGKFEDCAVITAKTTRESLDFGTFKSAVALVRFTITGDSYGNVVFTSPGADAVTVATPAAGTYYFAVPAGITLPSLKFTLGSMGTAESSTPVTLQAGDILCIDTPLESNMEVVGDIYITVMGSGKKDGSSWADAGDNAFLVSLLSDPASAGVLNGHSVNLSEGTFDLSNGEKGLSLSFGSPTALQLAGDAGKTLFTTSLTGAEGCILTVADANVSLSVSGITFTGASHDAAGGAVNLTAGTHRFSGCTFSNNKVTSTASDRTGGAIYVGGSASAEIEDCSFTGNDVGVTGGGALAFYAATVSKVVNCSFKNNNSGKIGNGGAILQKKAGGILYVIGCSFDSNACATNGADIFASAGSALLLYNCTAVHPLNNSANNRGSLRSNVPLLVANCTIASKESSLANGNVAFGVSGAEKNVIVNNLIVCDSGSSMSSAFTSSSTSLTRDVASYGHNIYTQAPNIVLVDKGGDSDMDQIKASDIWPEDIALSASGVLEWNGPAGLSGFGCATAAGVEAALKAFPTGGADFYNYLVAKGLFDKDATGTSRGDSWWPGAYQK